MDEIARMIDSRQAAGLVWLAAEAAGTVTGLAIRARVREGARDARMIRHRIFLDPGATGERVGEWLM